MEVSDTYNSCLTNLGEAVSERDLLQCVIQNEHATTNTNIRSVALVLAGTLVFSMQVSKFALHCTVKRGL